MTEKETGFAGRMGISAAFVTVTTLFFAWGFITSNNDPLIASLKASFSLSYLESSLTQFVFFLAYGLMSLPAASLINKVGNVKAILIALATMVAGCLIVQGVASYQSYAVILAALFVLAIGITVLQVAANPLVAALGPPESSHFRLTFAQTFNSLGVVIGVIFGSKIMLGDGVLKGGQAHITDSAERAVALGAVAHAFSLMAIFIGTMILFIFWSRHRIEAAANASRSVENGSVLDALKSRWAIWGAIAIGLYVGAEVSIGSFMINFLNQPDIFNVSKETAGDLYLAWFYWGGALAGRFIGSYLLTKIAAPKLLMFAASVATILCLTVAFTSGSIAGWAALAVGLFNSIMFPTIFTITLERAGVAQSSTSGLLCLAIVGGAVLPATFGLIGDNLSLSLAFLVPMLAYAFIAQFAFRAKDAIVYEASGDAAPAASH